MVRDATLVIKNFGYIEVASVLYC